MKKKFSSFKVYHSDRYDLPLPDGHRFPMDKYRLIREKLLSQEILKEENLFEAPLAKVDDILRVHSRTFYDAVANGSLDKKAQRLIGFPWSEVMIKRSRASVGGFVSAVESAIENGIAGNLSGGTHHSFADHGEGFCVFNDFAVAALKCIHEFDFHDILLIDLDVHQGNGNASILRNYEEVFVFSMHGGNNYPYKKVASDLDIDLPDNTDDEKYLSTLTKVLSRFSQRKWDIILYQAGVDPLKEDTLGKLALTQQGLKERDLLVLKFAKERNIPIALGLGGGYSMPISQTVQAHLNTYLAVKEVYY
ncbi:MAG: histone deacetylase [Halobacteriovoraceae bacterium]|nr:histone deacetylase [Halobacteriovoraceae bacterium]